MKLIHKTSLLLVAVTAISFGAAIAEHRLITVPMFVEFEAKADRKDVTRVLTGFDALRHTLHVTTFNYALSDVTYRSLQSGTPETGENHVNINTFIGNALDLAVLADRDGNIVWSQAVDLEQERFYPPDHYDTAELSAHLPDAKNALSGAPLSESGIIATELGPMIFSAYTVHRNDGTGDARGSLLLGRLVNRDTVQDVEQLVKIPFTVSPINAREAAALRELPLGEQVRNKDNTFDWYLPDIHGRPLLKLELQMGPSDMDPFLVNNPAILAFILTTLSWLVVVAYLHRSVVRPILSIKKHLYRIRSSGNYYYRLDSHRNDEVGDLSQECDLLIGHIEQQNKLLDRQAAELKQLSLQDSLTGLSNRRHLDELLANYWSLHDREQKPLSFILCDIDYFKEYNDNFGHQAGDEVLQQVASVIEATLARKTDKAARYGGEEFALLMADTDPLGVVAVARRLQKQFAKLAIAHPHSKIDEQLTISIGCTTLVPSHKTDPEELMRQADMALYRAKALGRNQIVIYDPDSSY